MKISVLGPYLLQPRRIWLKWREIHHGWHYLMALSLYSGEYQFWSTALSAWRIWLKAFRFTKTDVLLWHSPFIQGNISWGPQLYCMSLEDLVKMVLDSPSWLILWHSPFIQGNISLSPHLPQPSMIWLKWCWFTKADIILWHAPFI